jgi:hypothetical protein
VYHLTNDLIKDISIAKNFGINHFSDNVFLQPVGKGNLPDNKVAYYCIIWVDSINAEDKLNLDLEERYLRFKNIKFTENTEEKEGKNENELS